MMLLFLKMVRDEISRSRELHGDLHSAHEALGVMMEEWSEVKREIYNKKLDKGKLLEELVQLAAMCGKTAIDCGLLDSLENEHIQIATPDRL